jgi:pantoate--beta-alanine ligase
VTSPVLVRTRSELAAARDALAGRVAVVMTMGALHEGHLRLIDVARDRADGVLVTIFVNPLQFGPGEDLDRYPRTLETDLAACAAHGVDVVFAPAVEDMYPPGEPVVRRHAGDLGERLEGAVRPAHFDGVLTVVGLLLDLTRPDIAVFGEKDAQQLALIRGMVADEGRPIEVVGVATVREPDGLAMSSRNRYLAPEERAAALTLSAALRAAAEAAEHGTGAAAAADRARQVLAGAPAVVVDYVAVVDDETWKDPSEDTRSMRILVAGRVGQTRLIDNVSVGLGTQRAG